MTQEMIVAIAVVFWFLLFVFWRPPSGAFRWTVLVTAAFIGAAAVRYIPA